MLERDRRIEGADLDARAPAARRVGTVLEVGFRQVEGVVVAGSPERCIEVDIQRLADWLAPGGTNSSDLQPIVFVVKAQLAQPAVQVRSRGIDGDQAQVDGEVELSFGLRARGNHRQQERSCDAHQ